MAGIKRSIKYILGKEKYLEDSKICSNCGIQMERTTYIARRMINNVVVPIWYCPKCENTEEAY